MNGKDVFIGILLNICFIFMPLACSIGLLRDLTRMRTLRNISDAITNMRIISNNENSIEEMNIQTVEGANFTMHPLSKNGTITFRSRKKSITFYDIKDVIHTYSTIMLNIDNIKGTKK